MATLGPVDFPTLGFVVLDWMEEYLCHGVGDLYGDPWRIDDEMARFVCWAYRLDPKTGRRVFRRAGLSRSKGRAKSEIAAGLGCAEALAPVRFDGWDANGDPVGRPVRSPFVRCLATEEEQSGNTYDNVAVMLTEGRAVDEYPVDVGLSKTYVRAAGGGEITSSTASGAAKDGGKETFTVADETHLYVTPQLREMYEVVRRNTGKRKIAQPWGLDTTTAHRPGQDSIAERMHDRFVGATIEAQVAAGVLFDHRQGGELENFDNERKVIAALREAYGDAASWMDLPGLVATMREEPDPADARRYWLNQVQVTADQWIDPAVWAELAA